jgi:hypothetical protein
MFWLGVHFLGRSSWFVPAGWFACIPLASLPVLACCRWLLPQLCVHVHDSRYLLFMWYGHGCSVLHLWLFQQEICKHTAAPIILLENCTPQCACNYNQGQNRFDPSLCLPCACVLLLDWVGGAWVVGGWGQKVYSPLLTSSDVKGVGITRARISSCRTGGSMHARANLTVT